MSIGKRAFGEDIPKFYDPLVDPHTNKTYNLNETISVSLEDILEGVTKKVKIKRQEVCTDCSQGKQYFIVTLHFLLTFILCFM